MFVTKSAHMPSSSSYRSAHVLKKLYFILLSISSLPHPLEAHKDSRIQYETMRHDHYLVQDLSAIENMFKLYNLETQC